MKKISFIIVMILGITVALSAFKSIRTGGIQGSIVPVDGATELYALSGTDTLRAPINNGRFMFTAVKASTYTVWVKANPPYKDATINNVAVVDSASTNVWEIKLMQ